MGLPRAYRLTQKSQFDRVLKDRSLYLRSGPFRVYAVATKGDFARLGLIVGKRQARWAVDRNRIKRVLRETFRNHHDTLPHFDVVVQLAESIPRQGTLAALASDLWSAFCLACEKQHARPVED